MQVEKRRDEIQRDASESVFQDVWNKSKEFLEIHQVDNCPICQTPWDKTTIGSQDAAVVVLSESLGKLSSLTEQNAKLLQKIQLVKANLQQLETRLTEISSYANTLLLSDIKNKTDDLHARSAFYQQTLESAEKGKKGIELLLSDCLYIVDTAIPIAIRDLQAEDKIEPSNNIDDAITRLQVFKETIERLEALTRQQESIKRIEQEFNRIADRIRSEIKTVADNAVDALRSDVQKIYKKIYPGETVPNVFINLNTDEKTLTIRVNFHSNERIVPPGGYLSEAQINTLGLALFLSSVRLFNKGFPFVFLDDIVSSYDADNRARIVDVLAEDMQEFQIFLTTHDERFYSHLKGRLERKNWSFERISGYDFESGPQRETDNLRPDQIDTLIKQGNAQIAGNVVRQYLEEWFDLKCEKYFAYTPHRRGIKEYKRTLFDYWEPYITRIKNSKGDFKNYILDSDVYERLNGSLMPIINYYSHNQTNPYEWAAMGDVEYLWDVFQEFESLFACASCNKSLKYDFTENRFYCTCGKSIFPN